MRVWFLEVIKLFQGTFWYRREKARSESELASVRGE